MGSLDELLAQARPATRTVRICLRGDLIAAHEQAERELAEARLVDARENTPNTAPEVAQRVLDIEAEADAATITVEVKALSRKQWRTLLDEYPPSAEDTEKGYDYSPGFPTAAIAACSTIVRDDGPITLDVPDAEKLLDTVSESTYTQLFGTVLAVNLGGGDVPKSVAATATILGSGQKSTLPPPAGSPGRSS